MKTISIILSGVLKKKAYDTVITDIHMPSIISGLKLNGFFDFAGLEAFNADADPLRGAVYDSPDGLQVRQKSARGYAGYLLADTAFFLG